MVSAGMMVIYPPLQELWSLQDIHGLYRKFMAFAGKW